MLLVGQKRSNARVWENPTMTYPRVCTGCNTLLCGKLQPSLHSKKVQLIVHSPRSVEEQERLIPGSIKRGIRGGRNLKNSKIIKQLIMQSATTSVHLISLKHLIMRHLEHFKHSGMLKGQAFIHSPCFCTIRLQWHFFSNPKSIMNLLPCNKKFPSNTVIFFSIHSINCEHLEVSLGNPRELFDTGSSLMLLTLLLSSIFKYTLYLTD